MTRHATLISNRRGFDIYKGRWSAAIGNITLPLPSSERVLTSDGSDFGRAAIHAIEAELKERSDERGQVKTASPHVQIYGTTIPTADNIFMACCLDLGADATYSGTCDKDDLCGVRLGRQIFLEQRCAPGTQLR